MGGTGRMKRPALVLIDIQNDYFPGGKMELSGSGDAARNAALLLGHFRGERLPVLHVQHIAEKPGATFFLPGTEGAEIHASVLPVEGEPVIRKHFPNAFRGTDLLIRLRDANVSHLAFAGMMTHMCVDATVRAAADPNFSCLLASDACATRDLAFSGAVIPAAQVQAAFLAALGGTYAEVARAGEIPGRLAKLNPR